MRQLFLSLLCLGLCASVAHAQNPPPVEPPAAPKTDFSKIFKTELEKVDYAIGMYSALNLKASFKRQEMEMNVDAIAKGFADNLVDGKSLITEEQQHEILNELNASIRAKMEEKRKQALEEMRIKGEKNKTEGPAFLEKNKSEPGVVTLPSGLQYKVISEGSGPSPKVGDEVIVNYRGTLTDGTEFDSSIKRGRPYTTKLQNGSVIAGWVEALQLMKTGSKWHIYVPADLAYGESGRPPTIAPYSVLEFELELITTQTAAAMPAAAPASPGVPLTSDIIKVPSAEELKKGAKIETIKAEDLEKEKAKTKAGNP